MTINKRDDQLFSEDFIRQVKNATDMVQLASKYTDLKKVSSGVWQGKCPNPKHNDSTPSFNVWEKTQSWACMGCHCGKKNSQEGNYGSDCIAFLQWIENISWRESIVKLAEMAGIELPSNKNNIKYSTNYLLSQSYLQNLSSDVKRYLYWRGLSDEDISEWKIGFDGERIVFPLMDRYNNVLGFSRRLYIQDENKSKYRNSANNKIFNKGSYFYGMNHFDNSFDEIRITEGVFDVILPNKYGVKNIVATLGTAFTEHHVEIIKVLQKIPVFCMDGDSAGLKSLNRSIEMLAAAGIFSKVVILPEGQDMADIANKYQYETEQFILDNSMTYGFYKIRNLINQYDAKMTELKVKVYPDLMKILESIPDKNEKKVLCDYIEKKLSLDLYKNGN